MYKTKQDIKLWLDKIGINNYTINPDLSVDVHDGASLNSKFLTSIPVQFRNVERSFWCFNNDLSSLNGCPTHVGGNFWCHLNNLTSLEHCPTHISGSFWCSNNNITSLKDIHKQIKQINGKLDCAPNPIKSHILGVFFIKGLQEIQLSDKNVTFIVNKHLKGDRDVHQCQEELIKSGFVEYAKL